MTETSQPRLCHGIGKRYVAAVQALTCRDASYVDARTDEVGLHIGSAYGRWTSREVTAYVSPDGGGWIETTPRDGGDEKTIFALRPEDAAAIAARAAEIASWNAETIGEGRSLRPADAGNPQLIVDAATGGIIASESPARHYAPAVTPCEHCAAIEAAREQIRSAEAVIAAAKAAIDAEAVARQDTDREEFPWELELREAGGEA